MRAAVLVIVLSLLSGCIGTQMHPWDPGTVYDKGDIAIASGVPWISLADGNRDNFPPSCPAWWSE